jgi:hypothetical protein
VGIGTVSDAWQSAFTTVDVSSASAFAGSDYGVGNRQTYLAHNCYYDGNWKYKVSTDKPFLLYVQDGILSFQNAAGGTADGIISLSERMRIDSSGNVGIGTVSPVTKLDVFGPSSVTSFTGTSPLGVAVRGSTSATDYSGIDFSGNNRTTPTARIAVLSTGSGSSIWFGTSNSYVSGITNTALKIDNNGRVTTPNQPMFLGQPSVDYSSGGMPTGVMGITALWNNGSHFNAANSRFTAPVAGWYQTTWGGLQLSSTVTSLMRNGVRLRNGNHGVFTGSYVTMTQTAIEYLSAGDYLNIEQWNGGGYFSSWYLWSVTLLG